MDAAMRISLRPCLKPRRSVVEKNVVQQYGGADVQNDASHASTRLMYTLPKSSPSMLIEREVPLNSLIQKLVSQMAKPATARLGPARDIESTLLYGDDVTLAGAHSSTFTSALGSGRQQK